MEKRTEYGYNLPPDTTLYFWSPEYLIVRSYTLPEKPDSSYPNVCGFIYFRDKNGLWATEIVRSYWKNKPYFHPYATLFSVLYRNLLGVTALNPLPYL